MTKQEAIPGLLSHIESRPEREQKSLGLLGAMLSEWWHHVTDYTTVVWDPDWIMPTPFVGIHTPPVGGVLPVEGFVLPSCRAVLVVTEVGLKD